MHADPLAKFLQKNIKLPAFPIVRPFNWQRLFTTIALAVSIGGITKLAWPKIYKIITNKNSWAVASLVYQQLIKLTVGYYTDVHFRTHVQCD